MSCFRRAAARMAALRQRSARYRWCTSPASILRFTYFEGLLHLGLAPLFYLILPDLVRHDHTNRHGSRSTHWWHLSPAAPRPRWVSVRMSMYMGEHWRPRPLLSIQAQYPIQPTFYWHHHYSPCSMSLFFCSSRNSTARSLDGTHLFPRSHIAQVSQHRSCFRYR